VATWVYDLSTSRWSRFDSQTYDYWRPRLLANIGDIALAFDRTSNQVWRLDPDRATDGDEVFAKAFCAFLDLPEGRVDLANVQLDCFMGGAPREGQGSAPIIGLRVSRDEATYGNVRYRPMGVTGQRSPKPRWNALGQVQAPGAIL
jgi:hypothetical protein